MLGSKMTSNFLNRAKGLKNKLTVSEKLKGGRMEKIGNYFHTIYSDYQTVFLELLQDMRERPIKSSIYLSFIGASVVLYKMNPSENSFRTIMIESANELAMVGDPIRNTSSNKYIKSLIGQYKDGKVHYQSLGLFSIIYKTDNKRSLGLYSAQCKYVKPHWTHFHKRVLDMGLLGKWINTEKAMIDYDVNQAEWK